ncbi:MAG: ABC transporter ATP-binding protein [Pyrobaculum sp.]
MIELAAASKRYGRVTGLAEVTLTIASGESVAVIGENGAGKTTLLRLVSGVLQPTTGRVRVNGVTPVKRHTAALGIVGEALALKESFKVRSYLGIVARLSPGARRDTMMAIEALGVDGLLHKRIGQLSRGQRKRVALARAFICADRLLLLDEPFSGLDPGQVINLRKLIAAESASGKTIILNSHDLAELGTVAGRVIVLRRGELRFDGYLNELPLKQLWHFQLSSVGAVSESMVRSIPGVVDVNIDGQSLLIEVTSPAVVNELVAQVRPTAYAPMPPMEQIYRSVNAP